MHKNSPCPSSPPDPHAADDLGVYLRQCGSVVPGAPDMDRCRRIAKRLWRPAGANTDSRPVPLCPDCIRLLALPQNPAVWDLSNSDEFRGRALAEAATCPCGFEARVEALGHAAELARMYFVDAGGPWGSFLTWKNYRAWMFTLSIGVLPSAQGDYPPRSRLSHLFQIAFVFDLRSPDQTVGEIAIAEMIQTEGYLDLIDKAWHALGPCKVRVRLDPFGMVMRGVGEERERAGAES